MRYLEDFTPGLVLHYQGPTLSEQAIIEFASQYDPQPFHIDKAAAAERIFGGIIASGWHTMSITMRMLCDCYLLDAASMGSPGIDELRWLQPVRPGDTLALRLTVQDTRRSRSKPDRGIVHSFIEVLNQRDEVVMTIKSMGMFKTRSASPNDCPNN
jgi:acyl dehydratase